MWTFITVALFVATTALKSEECGICDRTQCAEIGSCPAGKVLDICGCCEVCARRLGQRCDFPQSKRPIYGQCGQHLKCQFRQDTRSNKETVCECAEEGLVCGSDNKTYSSLCHLLEMSVDSPDLFVQERSPCRSAPVIKTSPKDAKRPKGSILVLDCEAMGYPVPVITWELYSPDGSTIKLPSDDSGIAVQVRGGPEKHMATGWVQIMYISEESAGTYTCVATNDEGVAKAYARVAFSESASSDLNCQGISLPCVEEEKSENEI